jgi:hypothetical protein
VEQFHIENQPGAIISIRLHHHFSFSIHHILHQVLSHRPNVSLGAHCRPGAFSDVLALTVLLVFAYF